MYFRELQWSDTIKCDDDVWRWLTGYFSQCGGNMLVVDVGDAVRYRFHPEISCGGAWSVKKLRDELARCRDLGLEVIPKLNFSSCHDAWMRHYSRMLSTPEYYRVCRELIEEVTEYFDAPRFFHIGMDEENARCQDTDAFDYIVVRRGALWWHDLNYLCDCVRRAGSRPWMWSDKLWSSGAEEFSANVPRDVLQSNWYYREVFAFDESTPDYLRREQPRLEAYDTLDELGYDQIAAGSNWACDENYRGTVEYCTGHIAGERLAGFMMAPWFPTNEASREVLQEACDLFRAAHRGSALR